MDMIRLDSQCKNAPSLLFARCFNELLTAILELSSKNGLSSLGTPDEMIDDQMDAMFISLGLKLARLCRFHPFKIQHVHQAVKPQRLLAQVREKPASPPGFKPQRLAAGSLSVKSIGRSISDMYACCALYSHSCTVRSKHTI